jgi:hypothetical protein
MVEHAFYSTLQVQSLFINQLCTSSFVKQHLEHQNPSEPYKHMFPTMPLLDTLASLWSFCPAGPSISITSIAGPSIEAVVTEKPEVAISKAGWLPARLFKTSSHISRTNAAGASNRSRAINEALPRWAYWSLKDGRDTLDQSWKSRLMLECPPARPSWNPRAMFHHSTNWMKAIAGGPASDHLSLAQRNSLPGQYQVEDALEDLALLGRRCNWQGLIDPEAEDWYQRLLAFNVVHAIRELEVLTVVAAII